MAFWRTHLLIRINDDTYRLVRKDQPAGYGGYCNPEGGGETISVSLPVYSAPHAMSKMRLATGAMVGYTAGPEADAQLTDDGQWALTTVFIRDKKSETGIETRCAWLPTVDNELYVEGEQVLGENGQPVG